MASRTTQAEARTPRTVKSQPQTLAAPETRSVGKALGWLTLAGAWSMLALALASYDPADPPAHAVAPAHDQPTNWVGWVGAAAASRAYLMLGPAVWAPMLGVLAFLAQTGCRRPVTQPILRGIGLVVMAAALAGLLAGPYPPLPALAHLIVGVMPEGPGGLLGSFISHELNARFNTVGGGVTLVMCLLVGATLTMDHVVLALPRLALALLRAIRGLPRPALPREALAGAAGALTAWRAGLGPATGTTAAAEPPLRGRRRPQGAAGAPPASEPETSKIPDSAGGLGGTHSFDPDQPDAPANGATDDESPDQRPRSRRSNPKQSQAGNAWTDEAASAADNDLASSIEAPNTDVDADDSDTRDEASAPEPDDESDAPREHADPSEAPSLARGRTPDGEEEEEEVLVEDAPAAYVEDVKADRAFSPEELREKIRQLPIHFAPQARPAPIPVLPEPDLSGYRFPPLDILAEPEHNFTAEQEKMVREQAMQLEQAMREYRIEGGVVGIDSGPVITQFEVKLAPGTKVSKVAAVASDIARALKAQNVRVVPTIVGRDTIGVEVPNLVKEKVRLKELMTADPEIARRMSLPMFLGKDASGAPLIQDLAAMPHMLIAGTTGSGKSVCMNAIIMSFLFTKRPDELKLVLVDPKMVEMSMFRDIPHLMCPVVTEMSKAAAILEWAVTKMDERYHLLKEVGVRDIVGYNQLGFDEVRERLAPASPQEEAQIPKKLPYIVFVIDELADLMMTNREVEDHIVRIAQKARAVGIHLILATQRPQANVVTGLIKSNMPCRVTFKVASGMDSRIVLDQKGGELLLGHGDMLFLSPRTSKLMRAQGSLVDDGEVKHTVKFLRTVSQQSFEPQLVQVKGPGADEERDPLFNDAVEIVLETQRGSVSLLQRRLTIGYSRASRIVEQIAAAGILGEYKGSQAREVMITAEEWQAMKRQMEADAQAALEGAPPPPPVGAAGVQRDLFVADDASQPATTAAPALDREPAGQEFERAESPAADVAQACPDETDDEANEAGDELHDDPAPDEQARWDAEDEIDQEFEDKDELDEEFEDEVHSELNPGLDDEADHNADVAPSLGKPDPEADRADALDRDSLEDSEAGEVTQSSESREAQPTPASGPNAIAERSEYLVFRDEAAIASMSPSNEPDQPAEAHAAANPDGYLVFKESPDEAWEEVHDKDMDAAPNTAKGVTPNEPVAPPPAASRPARSSARAQKKAARKAGKRP